MTARLAGLVVESADPDAMARFWQGALGGVTQRTVESGELTLSGCCPELRFRPQDRAKTVKNRVHPDLLVTSIEPLLDLGATVLARYPQWVTLADLEGNEFCAFFDAPGIAVADPLVTAKVFALCVDSDHPEQLAAWWARRVGAQIGPGPDGTLRWLHGSTGWPGVIWKFVRVADVRVAPNRWLPVVHGDRDELLAAGAVAAQGSLRDPQGNEFLVL